VNEKRREAFMKALEHLQKRPHMYFSADAPAVANFLEGFKFAYLLLMPSPDFYLVFKEIATRRGWEDSPQAVWGQMRERGFDEEAIIAEMLAIHSEVFEKITSQIGIEITERNINGKA